MKGVGFSVADEIRTFVDFYADIRGTTPAAIAKQGMFAEIKRHPLNEAQIKEFESKGGTVPSAFRHTRPVRDGANSEG